MIVKFDFDELDLSPCEDEVTYKGKNYVLTSGTEDVARKFRNASVRAMRMADNKVVGVDGIADTQSLLVSLCLFEIYEHPKEGPKRRPVPQAEILTWHPKVVRELFNRAKEITDLDEKEDDTLDTLKKRMEDTKKKIDALEGGEDPIKNSPSVIMTPSNVLAS